MAGGCAFLSYRIPAFHDLFYPILLLTRSVPNISYIIVILLWFGSESSAAIVSFLIIFPTIYSSLYSGLQHMDEIQASLSNGISLTFKVGVMSEIMGQVPMGIGRQMNLCRLTSDMTGVFAWTGWIILILLLMDALLHFAGRQKV